MKKYSIILFTILFLVSCPENDDTDNIDGFGQFIISTDTTVYTWQSSESKDDINIFGTLHNESDVVYYTQMGDFYGLDHQIELLIAGNSTGYIEKYNEADKSWNEVELPLSLIEGAKYVPVRPENIYRLYGHLTKDKDIEETGIYRIRIDYYNEKEPSNSETPYRDYSNTFEIQ